MSIIDSATYWLANRYHVVRSAFKYRTPDKAPPYIRAELEPLGITNIDDLFREYNEKQLQSLARTIPWIVSNIDRIAKEVSSSPVQVVRRENKEEDINHDFEQLMNSPNEFFSGKSLLQYTIWALMNDRQGAYWYLAPDSKNSNTLREIWPVQINRIKPVKHATRFISHYEYDVGKGKKPLRINPNNICRFFFPDPWDLWKSMTPLRAAKNAMNTYQGISTSQAELFLKGQGVPLAIVSIDENIGDTDFEVVRQQIKEDWSGDKRLAVVRAGTMGVEVVGRSNKEMEIVANQEFNRDEIDTIYMGFPWRSSDYSSSEARKEINREIRETVIHPLHLMLAAQMQIHIINPFYGERFSVGFEDVRDVDRSLKLQEYNVTWRSLTLDEARRDVKKPSFEHELLPDLGELPFPLATNPSFVMSLYGLGQQQESSEPEEEMGNIEGSMSPEMASNLEARRGDREEPMNEAMRAIGVNTEKATKALRIAVKNELQNYRTICKRVVSRKEKAAHEVEFVADVVSDELMAEIRDKLNGLKDEDEIDKIFSEYIE